MSTWLQHIIVFPGVGGAHSDSLNLKPEPPAPNLSSHPSLQPPPSQTLSSSHCRLPWPKRESSPTDIGSTCPGLKEARWQSKWQLVKGLPLSGFPFYLVFTFWAVLGFMWLCRMKGICACCRGKEALQASDRQLLQGCERPELSSGIRGHGEPHIFQPN